MCHISFFNCRSSFAQVVCVALKQDNLIIVSLALVSASTGIGEHAMRHAFVQALIKSVEIIHSRAALKLRFEDRRHYEQ